MAKKIDFSIIIVDYHSADQVQQAVSSFRRFHPPSRFNYEIIIIDNSRTNRGFGAANNLGAKQARGEYLLFANPDLIFTGNILTALKRQLQKPHVGFVSPRLLLPSGEPQAYASGEFPRLAHLLLHKLSLPAKTSSASSQWLSGACLAVSRRIFELLGGFDPHFFMYFEDVDICHRALIHGLQNFSLHHVSVVHLGGGRTVMTRLRRQHYFAAQQKYFARYHPRWQYYLFLVIRFPYLLICYFRDLPS